MMEFHEYLRSRRSIRKFSDRAVSKEFIDKILETATWAPSAHNRQPWRFVVLSKRKTRQDLADAMAVDYRAALEAEGIDKEEIDRRTQKRINRLVDSPVAILLCLDPTALDAYDDPDRHAGEIQMGVQSVALAGGYLLLAAHASGLGAVWTCAPLFAQDIVRKALKLPTEWSPQALILMGYPDESLKGRERIPHAEVTHYM
jgi:F420 biosynthesis protein FbiB-like protein